ncbi:hypothetical protein MFLAVUS_009234 [Mucor flavus]|uniref:Mei2-like C-terminal RNA recognition motif domain-containing protein n=1 Tax=Mucor flavus TaxID=439312 RepID=A0ABP9Z9B9_9FUNG
MFGEIKSVIPFVLSDTSIISYFKMKDAQNAFEYINSRHTDTYKAIYAKSCLQKQSLDDRFFVSLTLEKENKSNYMYPLSKIGPIYSFSETFVSSTQRFVLIEYNDIRASKSFYEKLNNVTIDGVTYQIFKCENDHSSRNGHSASSTVNSNIIQRPYPKPSQKQYNQTGNTNFSYFSVDPFSSDSDSSSSSAHDFTVSPTNNKFLAANKNSPGIQNNLKDMSTKDRFLKDKPLKDQSWKEHLLKDQTWKEQALKGQPWKDQPLKVQPWKDQPLKVHPLKDQASKNQSSKNRSPKDRSSKDRPSKDILSKGRPSKGRPSIDRLPRDRPPKDTSSKDTSSKDTSSEVKSANHQQSNELDLKKIASGENKSTTFMIRNIPNKYTQKMLIESLDKTHANTYDFIYLRMDFKNKCNVGYAFINFVDAKSVVPFAEQRDGKKWEHFKSTKRCAISYATIQGKEALVRKFKSSPVMDEEEAFQPKLFYSSGPNKGKEQPFFKKPPQHTRSHNNKCYHKN